MYSLYLPVWVTQTLQESLHTPKVKRGNVIAQSLLPLKVGPVEYLPYCLRIRSKRGFPLYFTNGGGFFLCLLRALPNYFP